MATVTRVLLIDDLDQSEAAETVEFNLDKQDYFIDLSAPNADRLREKLQRFVDAATPVTAKAVPVKRSRGKAAAVATSKQDTQAIRAWAEQAGLKVSARGRIAQTVQDAYAAR